MSSDTAPPASSPLLPRAVRHHLLVVVTGLALGLVVGWLVAAAQPVTYASTAQVLVNPTIVTSKIPGSDPDPEDEAEGCLSVPGEAFPLKRADWARVSGFDGDGAPVEFEATGWFARCMQHEYDHLDGKLYVDRLNNRQGRKAGKAMKNNGWGVPGLTWMPGVDPDPFGH